MVDLSIVVIGFWEVSARQKGSVQQGGRYLGNLQRQISLNSSGKMRLALFLVYQVVDIASLR